MNVRFETKSHHHAATEDIERARRHMLASRERFFSTLPLLEQQSAGARREVLGLHQELHNDVLDVGLARHTLCFE